MDDIETYIAKIRNKKLVFGGFDKKIVYEVIKELCLDYQAEIDSLKVQKDQIEKELHKTINELDEADKKLQTMNNQIEAEKKEYSEYKERLNLLIQAVDVINMSKDKVIEGAKITANEIVAEANEEYEKIRYECLIQKKQMEIVNTNMMMEKQYFDISINSLREGMKEMLSRLDELQCDDNAQLLLSDTKW
jgi:uncharacterized coiled-coil DUF342 family protein